jgi:hypothetical protein
MGEAIRIETTDECVIMGRDAHLEVYQGDRLIAKVEVKVKTQKGADSGSYPAVEFGEVQYCNVAEPASREVPGPLDRRDRSDLDHVAHVEP